MKYFGSDSRRIKHALKVLDFAEKINECEKGDSLVVAAAAILHDIGIRNAEEKYSSSAGNYQEIEGPPVARKILESLGIDKETAEHVCKIIANHHGGNFDSKEFNVLWDSDWLVNIPDEFDLKDKTKIPKLIEKTFRTQTGRKIAEALFVSTRYEC